MFQWWNTCLECRRPWHRHQGCGEEVEAMVINCGNYTPEAMVHIKFLLYVFHQDINEKITLLSLFLKDDKACFLD